MTGAITMDDGCGRRLVVESGAVGTRESARAARAFLRNAVPGDPSLESMIQVGGRYVPLDQYLLGCQMARGVRDGS